jgi:CBS domain containing-hemolysin-like protein
MRRSSRLEDLLPRSIHARAEKAPGVVVALRVLISLQAVPLLALMIGGGWSGAAFLAPFLVLCAALFWLTFVRQRWSFAVLTGTEVIALLITLLSVLIGLIGATMSQGGSGLWEVLFIAALCALAMLITMVLLWSAEVHDSFNV